MAAKLLRRVMENYQISISPSPLPLVSVEHGYIIANIPSVPAVVPRRRFGAGWLVSTDRYRTGITRKRSSRIGKSLPRSR